MCSAMASVAPFIPDSKADIISHRHSSFLPPNFLRPVIGTFSAEGIGHDTADTSYKERAISLSRQQVINDAREGR